MYEIGNWQMDRIEAAVESDRPADRLRGLRGGMAGVLLLSGLIAMVAIGLALYSMMLLDVALISRSGASVIGMALMAVALLAALIGLRLLRHRLILGVAESFLHIAVPHIDSPRTFDRIRRAVHGRGIAALLDMLAIPPFCALLAVMGWQLGAILALGTIIAVSLLAWRARTLSALLGSTAPAHETRDRLHRMREEGAETLGLLGIDNRLASLSQHAATEVAEQAQRIHRHTQRTFTLLSVIVGTALIGISTAAVWLAAQDRGGSGMIAAALLLACFGLLPAGIVAAQLTQVLRARSAWREVRAAIPERVTRYTPMALPRPNRSLTTEQLVVGHAATGSVLLRDVKLALGSGDVLAIAGPGGCGKSALLKTLGGAIPAMMGKVRIDDAALDQWAPADRVRDIGYLPQLPSLLPGTIFENIARLDPLAEPDAVIRAAKAAGVHDLILHLPQGYETVIGYPEHGLSLSVQQRIALARACYGDPFVLLLDTPVAWQDRDGAAALARCVAGHRARGGIAIVAGTSPGIMDLASVVLVLRPGGVLEYGPRDAVRERMAARQATQRTSIATNPAQAAPVAADSVSE